MAGRGRRAGWVRLGFLALFALVLSRLVDPRAAFAVLAGVEPLRLVPVAALFGLALGLSSLRWRLSLGQMVDRPPPVLTLLRLYLIGLFVNLGLPTMAGGDVVRAEMLRPMIGERGGAYASILADRLIGLVAVAVLAVAALAAATAGIGADTRRAGAAAALILLGGAVLAIAGLARLGRARRWRRIDPFLDALAALARRPAILALCMAIAVVVQVAGVILPVALLAAALGIDLPWSVHFLLVPLVVLATLVPIAPNGLGLRETAFVVLYGPFGVGAEQAFALGLAWSLVLTAFGLMGGLVLLGGRLRAGAG